MNEIGSSNQYREVETLYQRVMDLPADRRDTFLARHCGDDIALRREVETLIEHYNSAGESFLGQPLCGPLSAEGAEALPERIGRYEIVRLLGQGGMGVVFEARQENPRRSVAVKAIRPGIASPRSLRRFEHEAAVLGRLQHTGIAHVYEAGVADFVSSAGIAAPQPFFAMEFIHGDTLGEYVRKTNLAIRKRLDLFARICDAVEHAHQKGIIHRDLKPGNVLVNEAGQPKILDFGVARVTDADLQLTTMHTDVAQVVGTLPYMSPEQVAGHADEVDTRSDVYSLGVIFFELLTGRLPYDLTNKPLAAAARVISESPPLALGSIQPSFRGDLETIANKALQKDAADRYASAHALAADVRRYLDSEPIEARPASAAYQFRKFAQRNKALVGGVAATFIALLLGVAGTGYGMLEMTNQRDQAELQATIANEVNEFLNQDLLAQANPHNEPDRDIRLRDVLDRAGERIEGRFMDAPLVEAAIRETLGITYRSLGELDSAETHLTRALELVRTELGEDDRKTVRLMLELGDRHRLAFSFEQADTLWRAAAERAERQWGLDDPVTLEARNNVAIAAKAQGRPEEAEAIMSDVLERRRRVLGDDNGATLLSMNTTASALQLLGRFDEAEPLYVESVARSRRVLGDEHPDTMTAISNLGLFYSRLDRFEKAEPLCLEVLELRSRTLGEDHPETLISLNNVGFFYGQQKRFDECEPYYTRAYEIRLAKFGPEHPDTLLSMNNVGWLYTQMERWDEAEPIITEMVDITGRVEPDSLNLALSVNMLGAFFLKRGRLAEAEPLLRQALEAYRTKLPDSDWRIGASMRLTGDCLRRLQTYEEAEPLLLEGWERLNTALGPDHHRTRPAVQALADLYTDWDRPAQAEQWLSRLD